jgi:hypothetical protein
MQDRPSLTLGDLVHVDASSADTEHPLVCGVEEWERKGERPEERMEELPITLELCRI